LALTSGTRLGVYEVTEQIGAGGMGGVSRATDTNLKRSVAIKVPTGPTQVGVVNHVSDHMTEQAADFLRL
jgi:serine/threonine protein kinase